MNRGVGFSFWYFNFITHFLHSFLNFLPFYVFTYFSFPFTYSSFLLFLAIIPCLCLYIKSCIYEYLHHRPYHFNETLCVLVFLELELYEVQCESQTRVSVHTVQLLPEQSFRENENKEVVTAEPDGNAILTLRVAVHYVPIV